MSVSSFSQTGSERHLSARGQVFSPSRQETGASEPLRQPDDLADRIILQLPAEAVAAALAALPLDQSRAREHGDDAL